MPCVDGEMIVLSGPDDYGEWKTSWKKELIRLNLLENVIWKCATRKQRARDHIAITMISSSVSDPISDYVKDCETAAEMWEVLKYFDHHEILKPTDMTAEEISIVVTMTNEPNDDVNDSEASEDVLNEMMKEDIYDRMDIEVHDGVCDPMVSTEEKEESNRSFHFELSDDDTSYVFQDKEVKEVMPPRKIVNSRKAVNRRDLFDDLFDEIRTGSRTGRTKGRIKSHLNERQMMKQRMIGVRFRRKGRIKRMMSVTGFKRKVKIKGDKGRRRSMILFC
jgi:hypothetical protein